MNEIISDSNLVAYCGLYCGACKKYLNSKCPGCHENQKATWCKIRTCSIEKKQSSCAECTDYSDIDNCKKYNNAISKIIGFVLKSNRKACIAQIREKGLQGHADEMAKNKTQTLKK
ncbi:MAG: DUF3795 domain-containing protein [Desulfotalea sp.]